MNQLNSVLIEGNLTRDPVIKTIGNGNRICNFSIATNRSWKKGEEWVKEVSYIDVECWQSLADNISKIEKGRGVRVVGRIAQDRWTDKDGKAMSKIKIVAEHVEIKPKGEGKKQGKSDDFNDSVPF